MNESFSFAFSSVRTNKLRTFLSLLGVSIGIFAIISVFTMVDALEKNIRDDVEALGSNVVYIDKWPWTDEGGVYKWWEFRQRPGIEYKDYLYIKANSKLAEETALITGFNREVKYKNNTVSRTPVHGVTYEWNDVYYTDIEFGRYFTMMEANSGANVAVIGSKLAEDLFEDEDPLGKIIKVDGHKTRVIGVAKRKGESMVNMTDTDNLVMLPMNYARNMMSLRRADPSIAVKAKHGVDKDDLKGELRMMMRMLRRLSPSQKDNFSLNEISLLEGQLASIFGMLNIVGMLIGGFSILIGGFGIANIMFVSVKERTNIIGIQKALGAKKYFILTQFLFEATLLAVVGGMVGLAIVYALSALVSGGLGFAITLTFANIMRGIVISGTIGIVSGFIPAYTAARLNPVEAINSK
ncbi:MAG: ABC transporter permease [Prevotellaceae bacterium]|nr:ABC transporter permease [Prevotellaceae bacterium]